MSDFVTILLVLALAFCIYFPVLRIARRDMNARVTAGLSAAPVLMILMLPIVGPLFYLLVRRYFLP